MAQALVGVFRDSAPQVVRAELRVVGSGVVVRPCETRGYPDGFVLAQSQRLSMWQPTGRDQLKASGPALVPSRLLTRFQGGSGPWLLLETGGGNVCAFRPDDWSALHRLLDDAGVPVHESRPSQQLPEPNGGLLAIAMLSSFGAFFASLLAFANLPAMTDGNNVAVLGAAIALWAVAGAAVLVAPAVSRAHRRRHSQASTVKGPG